VIFFKFYIYNKWFIFLITYNFRLEEWFDKICSEVNQNNLKDAIDLVSTNSVKIMDLLESEKQIKN
jgi:hypothetical protein